MSTETVRARVVLATRKVEELVTEVLEGSEQHILAAGESVAAVNKQARAQVAALEKIAEVMTTEGTGTGLVEVLERQVRWFEQSAVQFARELHGFEEVTSRGAACTRDIEHLSAEIASIALSTKILTINAQIEARRLGNAGAAFGVIAAEMNALSRRVGAASGAMASIVAMLAENLPSLAQSSRQLARQHEANVEENRKLAGEARQSYENARTATAQGVEASRNRAKAIVRASTDVLTALQYNETMRRQLETISAALSGLIEDLESSDHEVPQNATEEQADAEAAATEPPEEEAEAMGSGEMLLF